MNFENKRHILIKVDKLTPSYVMLSMIVAILVAAKVGCDVAEHNYVIAALLFIVTLIFVVFASTKNALILLLLLGFTGHQIIQFGAPPQMIYCWDLIVILLFLKTLLTKFVSNGCFQLKGLMPVFGIIAVIIISHIVNKTSVLQTILFSRYLISGYLIFFSVLNLRLNEGDAKTILRFVIFLFLVQIPASFIKLLILGQGEQSVGTFGFSPGTLGTLVPLIAISFLFAFIVYNPAKRNFYILLILGFISFSLIAEKRAFFFLLPVTFLFIYILYKGSYQTKIKILLLFFLVFLFAGYLYPRLNPTMNPQNKIWGDFSPRHIYNFLNIYVNSHDKYGNSCGRVATTRMTIKNLKSTKSFFLFGDGPGKLIKSGIIESNMYVNKFNYNIEDGITGFTWISLQVGTLGFLFFVVLLLSLLQRVRSIYKNTSDKFLNVYGLGLLGTGFVFLLDLFIYSKAFVGGRNLSLVFFLLTAIYCKYGRGELSTDYKVIKL